LSGTQFSTLNSAGINDPEGPKNWLNNRRKSVWILLKGIALVKRQTRIEDLPG
jgi:hypothetical protein